VARQQHHQNRSSNQNRVSDRRQGHATRERITLGPQMMRQDEEGRSQQEQTERCVNDVGLVAKEDSADDEIEDLSAHFEMLNEQLAQLEDQAEREALQ